MKKNKNKVSTCDTGYTLFFRLDIKPQYLLGTGQIVSVTLSINNQQVLKVDIECQVRFTMSTIVPDFNQNFANFRFCILLANVLAWLCVFTQHLTFEVFDERCFCRKTCLYSSRFDVKKITLFGIVKETQVPCCISFSSENF